jgi:hypothetical protein
MNKNPREPLADAGFLFLKAQQRSNIYNKNTEIITPLIDIQSAISDYPLRKNTARHTLQIQKLTTNL